MNILATVMFTIGTEYRKYYPKDDGEFSSLPGPSLSSMFTSIDRSNKHCGKRMIRTMFEMYHNAVYRCMPSILDIIVQAKESVQLHKDAVTEGIRRINKRLSSEDSVDRSDLDLDWIRESVHHYVPMLGWRWLPWLKYKPEFDFTNHVRIEH